MRNMIAALAVVAIAVSAQAQVTAYSQLGKLTAGRNVDAVAAPSGVTVKSPIDAANLLGPWKGARVLKWGNEIGIRPGKFEFLADGSINATNMFAEPMKGTWKLEGDKLTMTLADNSSTMQYTAATNGRTLILSVTDAEGVYYSYIFTKDSK